MCVCLCVYERKKERKRKIDRERQRDRETEIENFVKCLSFFPKQNSSLFDYSFSFSLSGSAYVEIVGCDRCSQFSIS